MDVDRLIAEAIGREGGYVNHPADKGGPTRWGVTEQVARRHGYAGDMREYPREAAIEVYRRIYWQAPGFDRVAALAPRVAAELFDTGINMGVETAAGFLQRALNALNRNGTDYADVVADKKLGPATLGALDGFLKARGRAGEVVLLKALDALQGERYVALSESRQANEAFVYGWLAARVWVDAGGDAPLAEEAAPEQTAPPAPAPPGGPLPDGMLSPHFSLAEFIRSDTARRLGDANLPTPEHLANLKVTAAGFERVREILGNEGITITSGYRNPRVNRAVGGTPTSDHPQGWVGDFRHKRLSPLECARLLRDSDLQFDQLILETGRGIVHLSFNPRGRRMVGEQRGGPGTKIEWRLP